MRRRRGRKRKRKRKSYRRTKFQLLFTLLTALASPVESAAGYEAGRRVVDSPAVLVKGREFSASGSAAGYEGGRRLAEHSVSTMAQLYDKVSNYDGMNVMANGDTTTLSVGEYKCSDGTCADSSSMLATNDLYGTIQCFQCTGCLNDEVPCVLNGESSRRGMSVSGTGTGTLTIRAIRFYKGHGDSGGGLSVLSAAKVDITLCVFDSCKSTMDNAYNAGGGLRVSGSTVNIYATSFTGNSAVSGLGRDLYVHDRFSGGGKITIHDTCPSPYSANTPTKGKGRRSNIDIIASL